MHCELTLIVHSDAIPGGQTCTKIVLHAWVEVLRTLAKRSMKYHEVACIAASQHRSIACLQLLHLMPRRWKVESHEFAKIIGGKSVWFCSTCLEEFEDWITLSLCSTSSCEIIEIRKSYQKLLGSQVNHEWRRLRRYTGTLHMYTNSFISLRVLGRLLHEHARCINEWSYSFSPWSAKLQEKDEGCYLWCSQLNCRQQSSSNQAAKTAKTATLVHPSWNNQQTF